ncbi:hypothetical protein D3C72_2108090 [compost metagenome]
MSVVPMAAAATSKRPLATEGMRAENSCPVKITWSFLKPRRSAMLRKSSMSNPEKLLSAVVKA